MFRLTQMKSAGIIGGACAVVLSAGAASLVVAQTSGPANNAKEPIGRIATTAAAATSAPARTTRLEEVYTLKDTKRHFHLDFPPSWGVNTQTVTVEHYSMVFAALNSAGIEKLTVKEMQTGVNSFGLDTEVIGKQVPAGTAYIDVSWQEGPTARWGPGVQEMEAGDLAEVLKGSKEIREGEILTRVIAFSKWGRQWHIKVYMHVPIGEALRGEVEKVLGSFRFDGVPAGDTVWAIGEARKHLPAEADPEKFTREGGSPEYNCGAKVNGDEVLVTFRKHVGNVPEKTWKFRVTAKGEVTAVDEG